MSRNKAIDEFTQLYADVNSRVKLSDLKEDMAIVMDGRSLQAKEFETRMGVESGS